MKRLILLVLILAGCATAQKSACPPVDAIHHMPGYGLVVTPKGFYDWRSGDDKYWMPLDEYMRLYEMEQRRDGGS